MLLTLTQIHVPGCRRLDCQLLHMAATVATPRNETQRDIEPDLVAMPVPPGPGLRLANPHSRTIGGAP